MTHTSIQHLLSDDTSPQSAYDPSSSPPPQSVSTGKETAPLRIAPEMKPIAEPQAEATSEQSKESAKSEPKPHPKIRLDTPQIDPTAAAAGLQVAPSASPFPSVYDVKIPLLTDDQVIADLKESPLTGKRWLAELGQYLLWQARIKLKRVGDKTVRVRVTEEAGFWAKLKRLFWM